MKEKELYPGNHNEVPDYKKRPKCRKTIITIWLCNVFLLFTVTVTPGRAQFTGGSGTEEDPYQIATLKQLQAVGDSVNLDKHFIQIADIDASATADWNGGKGFEPIGKQEDRFTGSYNGAGHLISNLTINRPDESWLGLFNNIRNAIIKQLYMEQVDIRGEDGVGALVGFNSESVVSGVVVNGKVSGNRFVGGLVGHNEGTIRLSHADVQVTGYNFAVGGLVGYSYGIVEYCFATGDVTGNQYSGGLIGMNGRQVHHAYATGDVSGSSAVGRLVGGNTGSPDPAEQSIITETYATGQVSATYDDDTGGIAGYNPGRIYRSYWRVPLNSKRQELVGGIFRQFWRDNDHEVLVTGPPIDEMWGLSVGQMTGQNAFIYMYKLDFENTWQLTEGYPVLRWQDPEDAVDPPEVPIIRIDTTKRDFGEVSIDSSVTVEVPIRNSGNNMLNGEVYLAGPDAALFVIADGLSTFSLEVDSSQAVAITFYPESQESYEAELHVVHDAPNRSDTLIIPLSGQGKEPTDATPDPDLPGELTLHQNYPNPFNPVTVIEYALPESAYVTLRVYDVMGRLVETLVDGIKTHGKHQVTWDASDAASGNYIYRLQADDVVISRKLMLIK